MSGTIRHFIYCLGLILALFVPGPARAIDLYKSKNFFFTFKGYYRNIFFTSQEELTGDPFYADFSRIRTEWDLGLYDIFSTKVIWDNELIAGDFVNTPEYQLFRRAREIPYIDLESQVVKVNDFAYNTGLYRAYFRIDKAPMAMIVGRQQVDWGVVHLLSPNALYTPVTLFNIEKDVIIGTTATNLIFTVAPGIKINPVYSIESEFSKSRTGLRFTKTVAGFDLSAFGGRFLRDTLFGFDFSGQIKGMGIRGEFFYDFGLNDNHFPQAALEVDYAYKNFYFDLEYFFNGQGTNNFRTALPFPATANQIKSVYQNFLGMQVNYKVLPQLTVMFLNVIDLNGGSVFLNPEIQYSPYAWLEFLAGVQLPAGRKFGEFTHIPNFYYFQSQIYF